MTTEKLLSTLIKIDKFHNSPTMVSGIAQLAIDKGYNQLSDKQKGILKPFLSEQCSGSINPGGYHNGCKTTLTESTLLDAYESTDDSDNLQCETCREEDSFYDYQREKLDQE
ncbi:hypothetical protein GNP84_06815 [Aliivibrio fischeri]|uniref:hypothetical protein n=1 Tax=Aliivibrio fischeri TaxID=668 RepID=UPI0012D9584A|nr:hypothetical protein [Aliivibrio fischeri]MUK76617.1 hypothetical protein [Aliivibrio fischeri]